MIKKHQLIKSNSLIVLLLCCYLSYYVVPLATRWEHLIGCKNMFWSDLLVFGAFQIINSEPSTTSLLEGFFFFNG